MRFIFRILSINGTETANYATIERFLKSIMKGPLVKISRLCLPALKSAVRGNDNIQNGHITFTDFATHAYDTSDPNEPNYKSHKLQVLCEMLGLVPMFTIDNFIE